MTITNSFHSSAKKHAIGSASKLMSCELHNSRGYHSFYYDKNKISDLIGASATLSADTEAFINKTFSDVVDAYNEKQKRQDRKIRTSAFEYFCDNKNLDIATEAIFQVGAKAFWDQYRIDTVIQTRKGEKVIKDFPEQVKAVMNEIFTKQGEAYEHIYETHGAVILAAVQADKAKAENTLNEFSSDELEAFAGILKKDTKDRKPLIEALPDPNKYFAYAEAAETMATIKKLKLEDRIENSQMHIKLVNLTGHYDEFSPHAHGISVCWADGYGSGLESRVAKSVVLNKWSLSVIQDRLHKIAFEEMQKHPEIFAGENLGEKQIGRNFDYSAEQMARKQQQALLAEKENLQTEIAAIAQEGQKTIAQYRAESRELEAQIDHLQETQFHVLNELNSIIENSAETLTDLVEQSVDRALENSDGTFDNVSFFIQNCSDEEFDELSEKGYALKKQMLRESIDVEPMQVGLDNLVKRIEQNKVQLSWAERQYFWDLYKEVSGNFWNELSDLQSKFKFEIGAEYDNRRAAMRSFYDAQYLLRSTRNVFVMLYAAIKAFMALDEKREIEAKIEALKRERRELISNTATFKKYSQYVREELKTGRKPCEKYFVGMADILLYVDGKQDEILQRLQNKRLNPRKDR